MKTDTIKLDFVVIGGQKCGSTYLQNVIYNHPDIEMVKGEVPLLENPDYDYDGLQKLSLLLGALDQNKTLGIKRPNYLHKLEVVDRMLRINKDVKAIVMLRNPLERFMSAYFHYMNNSFAPAVSLNTGVKRLLDGKLKKDYPRTDELLAFGFYAEAIEYYQSKLHDNLLVLFYDDLKKDKLNIIKKCYAFLSVDENFMPSDNDLNSTPQKVNYALKRAWFLRIKNKYQYTYNEDKTRLFLKEQSKWDKMICRRIDQIDKHVVSRFCVDDKKPAFSLEVKQKLIEIYREDVETLQKRFKVDLTHWLQ